MTVCSEKRDIWQTIDESCSNFRWPSQQPSPTLTFTIFAEKNLTKGGPFCRVPFPPILGLMAFVACNKPERWNNRFNDDSGVVDWFTFMVFHRWTWNRKIYALVGPQLTTKKVGIFLVIFVQQKLFCCDAASKTFVGKRSWKSVTTLQRS